MNLQFQRLLWRYENADWLLQRKARILLILSIIIFLVLLLEIVVSQLLLGSRAPEFFPNLFLAVGFALLLIPLLRGSYGLAAGLGIFVALAGISWTRYVSTGFFSSEASYDFIQYVVDLILVLFYVNLIAQRKLHIIIAIGCSLLLLTVYLFALPAMVKGMILPATISVFISGYIFFILSGLLALFTFQQNQRAIEKVKQESEASRRSEQKYSEIYNSTNEAIFIYDASTLQIVDVNDAVLHMYGFETKDQVFAFGIEHLSQGLPPFTGEEAMNHFQNAREHGPQIFEWHATKRTGEHFWVEISLRKSEIGGKSRILAVVRDITERKHSEERLRTVEFSMDRASDAVFWMDHDAGFLYVNEQACHSLGYTHNELLELHLWDIDPVFPREQWDANWAESQKNQESGPNRLETFHRRKDGTIFPVEVSWNYICFGEIEMHIVFVRDITERKRAEKALQESEEVYRKLITTVPDVIVRTDLEGTVVFVNDTNLQPFGYSNKENIIGKNILSLVREEDKDRAGQNIMSLFNRYLGPQEYSLLGDEGAHIDCEVNGDILRHNDGTPFGMVFFIRDLTEKKKMQVQLVQSQKMEAVGRLAGGVAHDYNNMLGVILGYTSMIEKELPSHHPAQSKIKAILSAAERSANLTKQLLAFARQQIIAPVVVNLNEELIALQKMIGRLIGEDIKVVYDQEQNLWNTKIDPTQLTQIITNFATNARDAIENVGTITIGTANIIINEAMASEQGEISPGEFVMLSFSDSGIGMDKKVMSHIFEPFFTTKSSDKGTGLGLATVFGVVKQNNGFITVSSEPGLGTSFKVYLPRFVGDSMTIDFILETLSLEGKETILLVEDEEELLKLTKLTLAKHGYKVLSALSPTEAITVIEKSTKPIDLLITDVVMPGMNGKELKEWVEKKYQNIKTLFISGYTSDIVARRGILEEGVHFLQKPFTLLALLKKVKEVLHGSEGTS